MRTLGIVALIATVVSCHLDKLLNAGGGAPPTSHGTPVQLTVAPGPPTQLRFTVQPSNATQNAAITPPVEVTASDSLGNTATNFTGEIWVALGKDPGVIKARLTGATRRAAVAGVATFDDLRIAQTGVGYTLSAAF